MFKHMSLLFYTGSAREESRSVAQGEKDTQSQTRLCMDVLDIFQQSSRVMGHRFSSDTWDTVLKIILGCCDFLLATPEDTLSVAKLLAPRLLEVLFEVWLRSRNADDEMWAHLKGLVMNWRHRIPTIHQWSATTLGLTQNLINLLYGPSVGTNNVLIML
jgi:RALGAPB N-terminal domain